MRVVVIGAGQAGLATSFYLKQHGIEHVVLDENDRVGDVWRNRWDSLRLFTPVKYSSLPGMPLPGSPHDYPTKDEMAEYFEAYVVEFDLPIELGTRVDQVSFDGRAYHVVHGRGEVVADDVVVATGAYHHPHVPDFASEVDDDIFQIHSHDYRRPEQVPDGPVLVVGAGNSGAEIALELASDHDVWLSGRDVGQEPTKAGTWPDRLMMPLYWLIGHRVSQVTNPIGRKIRDSFLDPPRGVPRGRVGTKDIAEAGIQWVGRVVGVADGLPVLADGRHLAVRGVVWCTGFSADYRWIDLPVFGEYGLPEHDRGVVWSQPGLYFMGLMFQTAISSALVGGVDRDASYITKQIRGRPVASPRGVRNSDRQR